MKITFLGTSSMVPTKERNTSAILLSYKGEDILIDCGEGTQRQLKLANVSPTKIKRVLITHWHGDHVLGIPGLLQTIASSQKESQLEIFGPIGTKKFLENMSKMFSPYSKLRFIPHEIKEEGKIIDEKDYEIHAKPVIHSTHCLAYSFKEKDKRKINLKYTRRFGLVKHPLLGQLQKGKAIEYKGKKITPDKATTIKYGIKVTLITDCEKTKDLEKFAAKSDILISESTYSEDLIDMAKEKKHLTSKQAAGIAKNAKVKKLVLTHFSQRYKTTKELEKEAKTIFKNTVAAKDLMTLNI